MPALKTALCLLAATCLADDGLRRGLTFHAPFDGGFNAASSADDPACRVRAGGKMVSPTPGPEMRLATDGKFGACLVFPKKGTVRPEYAASRSLAYGTTDWSATVSVWLRLDPDKDLEPGYCDPVQIVGDDGKKGFIFLEWSKDETPRFFRFAIRPLQNIWDPKNVGWGALPFEQRPMVQVARAPFSRDTWTHAVFTLDKINDKSAKPTGRLWLNGKLQGAIENWDLTFDWKGDAVNLVLGAAYVGHLDDLAVFDRALTDAEVKQLMSLKNGVRDLRP